LVVAVVVVDFVLGASFSGDPLKFTGEKFPTNFHTSDNIIAFVRLSPGAKNE
jgi:hypothetical protein